MAGYPEQARLLRLWRVEVTGLTQQQAADCVVIRKSAVSMWENAERGITFAHLEALDRCYSAGGALQDIALAMGTPAGLAPRRRWVHNPQGDSDPVWAWCRPRAGRGHVSLRVRWGAFAFDCSSACDDRGIFLTSPVSTPNPPAWVDLDEPAWVDFGRGEIPEQLGIPTFDALSGLRIGTGAHTATGLVAPALVERFTADSMFAEAVLEFFGEPRAVVHEVFTADDPSKTVVDLTTGVPETSPHGPFSGNRYRQLRKARCLSLADVASLMTSMLPSHPVTDDQIRLLETGRRPRPLLLASRLDRAYKADGYSCREKVSSSLTRPLTFHFPSYWIGPIWFTVSSDQEEPVVAELRCGRNCKRMLVKAGTTVTCRRATEDSPPFKVICPKEWDVAAGMGMHPQAWDVNWGWFNLDDYNSREDDDVHPLFLELFGRTKEEFTQFLLRYEERSAQ